MSNIYKSSKDIIERHLDENADLLIGLDDPELGQLIKVLTEGVATAIEHAVDELQSEINNINRSLGRDRYYF